jgi:murein DD-endopeptidase MepM/ murein hydrolase activator NlpD
MTPAGGDRGARWLAAAPVLALLHLGLLGAVHARPGPAGPILWQVGPLLLTAGAIVALGVGLVQALGRRLHWTPWRGAAFLLLVAVAYMPLAYRTYPSSRDASPSAVRFRLPLDGPVTVVWGGPTREVNYHVRGAAERWAYDLLVTERGQSYRTSGLTVDDYSAYGQPVLAPAAGRVRLVTDGLAESRIGTRALLEGCGNRVVIEVAPSEYLFLCHLQAGTLMVREGQIVSAGDEIGRVGNSGNSTEPHIHVHLQTTPGPFGEGIPMYFHDYRAGATFVPRGMPVGGPHRQVLEHTGRAEANGAIGWRPLTPRRGPRWPLRGRRSDDPSLAIVGSLTPRGSCCAAAWSVLVRSGPLGDHGQGMGRLPDAQLGAQLPQFGGERERRHGGRGAGARGAGLDRGVAIGRRSQ